METRVKLNQLEVELGHRSYPILIGPGASEDLAHLKAKFLDDGRKIAALVDGGLLNANPSFLSNFLSDIPYLVIPSGEGSKCVESLDKGWSFLASQKIDRKAVVFVFGGGVTGDLGGFLAASYLRGIEFVQVPSTLLSMVDSSVGGKTGINLSVGKNLVGAFHQPSRVIIDLNVLSTLPSREFSAGMAEVIKYGMLGNISLYQRLLALGEPLSSDSMELGEIIYQCCADKADIVRKDEQESVLEGGRALLNLGHTFGHAIEAVAGYGNYLHGEAVSIGLVCAFRLSKKLGFCIDESEDQLLQLLKSYALPVGLFEPLSMAKLKSAMMNDKKVQKGTLRFVVMREIGHSFINDSVELKLVDEVLESIGVSK